MSYSYVWPTTLPQSPQKDFGETAGANVLRTPMDKGPAKLRLRGKSAGVLTLNFFMTTEQVALFEEFLESTIKYTSRFGFTHPRKQVTVECRIVPQGEGNFYTLKYLAPGYYNLGVTFEVMP